MRVLISRVTDTGHVVLTRLPEGARFLATFTDDHSERDVTDFAADLVLTGALDQVEVDRDGRPAPAEEVEAARVRYVSPAADLGQALPAATFTWVHLPSRDGGDFPAADVLPLLTRGLGVEVTAAVAAEAAGVPEDASTLTDPQQP